MGLIRKTTAWILILLGIMLGFIPAIGLFIGLPTLLIGIFIYRKGKKKKITEEEFKNAESSFNKNQDAPLLLKVKPITKSKKYLLMLIALAFLLLIFGPKQLGVLSMALIIWLFLSYNKIKHMEWLASGKKANPKHFYLFNRPTRYFSGGVLLVILGFLVLLGPISVFNNVAKEEGAISDYIISRIAALTIGWVGILFMFLGFLSIRFSYRNPYKAIHNFKVIEPGKIVISKQGIKHRTSKESSN